MTGGDLLERSGIFTHTEICAAPARLHGVHQIVGLKLAQVHLPYTAVTVVTFM